MAQSSEKKDSLLQQLSSLPDGKLKAKVYLELANHAQWYENLPKDAELWADTSYSISKKLKDKHQIMRYWKFLATLSRVTSKYQNAIEYCDAALNVCELLGDSSYKAVIINEKATTYRWNDNHEKAIRNYLHSRKLAEENGLNEILLYNYNGLGNSYTILRNFKVAMEYYETGLKMAYAENNKLSIAINLNNIGELYEYENRLVDAEKNYEQSLKLNAELNNLRGISLSNTSIGNLAFKKGSYDEALSCFRQAYEINTGAHNIKDIALSEINLGKTFTALKKYEEAKKFLNSGLVKATEIDSKSVLKDAYLAFSKVHSATRKYKEAYEMMEKYAEVSNLLFDSETANTISILRVQYNLQKSENELVMLKEKNVSVLEAKRRNWFIYGSLGTTLFLFLISILVWIRGRERKRSQVSLTEKNLLIEKMNKELQEENDIRKDAESLVREMLDQKEVLISEIHHRVKNNLAMISGLLHLELSKISDEGSRQVLTNTSNRIQAIALIHENLYNSEKDAHIVYNEYLNTHIRKIIDSLNSPHKVELYIEAEQVLLGLHQAVPVSLIVNELITNVLTHAYSENKTHPKLNITLHLDNEGNITLQVKDNGKGLDENLNINKVESAGFTIVSIFVRQLKAEFSTKTSSEGTAHTIKFKQSAMKVWK